ncbi:hypothetical protein CYJ44_010475 [Corynebacterium hesseae]|uniref:Uncharacterized protein n=1 Tax=Corynebacterium hesseae TaxID=2913502 RepID=A0ABU9UK34_9CORY|nr:hypothetical protein [Corynebacterium aurimucosum]
MPSTRKVIAFGPAALSTPGGVVAHKGEENDHEEALQRGVKGQFQQAALPQRQVDQHEGKAADDGRGDGKALKEVRLPPGPHAENK